jgi:hypothetical protein
MNEGSPYISSSKGVESSGNDYNGLFGQPLRVAKLKEVNMNVSP